MKLLSLLFICVAIFIQSSQTFEQRWMRIVPCRVEPVSNWEAQIVLVKLNKRRLEEVAFSQSLGEFVRLEFEATSDACHEERDELVVGREYELDDDYESDQYWSIVVLESERRVEDLSVHQDCEYEEIEQCIDLGIIYSLLAILNDYITL